MVLAHIAGMPVEETLLGLAPAGLAGAGLAVALVRNALERRPGRGRRRDRPPA